MIAYLSGKPLIQGEQLIIITQGVGYGVFVGNATFQKASQAEHIELFIHTHVREDDLSLFGFMSQQDKKLFLQLLDVSGVGPKTALIISDCGATQIIQAVQSADVAFFSSIPRVGKKMAQKIIIELKSKLGSMKELDLKPESQHQSDVADALRALGFSDNDVQKAFQTVEVETLNIQEAITQSIKVIGGR